MEIGENGPIMEIAVRLVAQAKRIRPEHVTLHLNHVEVEVA